MHTLQRHVAIAALFCNVSHTVWTIEAQVASLSFHRWTASAIDSPRASHGPLWTIYIHPNEQCCASSIPSSKRHTCARCVMARGTCDTSMKLRVYDHLVTSYDHLVASHCSPPAGSNLIERPGRFHQLEELLPVHLTVAVKVKLFDVLLHLVRIDARLVERLRQLQCVWQGAREPLSGGAALGGWWQLRRTLTSSFLVSLPDLSLSYALKMPRIIVLACRGPPRGAGAAPVRRQRALARESDARSSSAVHAMIGRAAFVSAPPWRARAWAPAPAPARERPMRASSRSRLAARTGKRA